MKTIFLILLLFSFSESREDPFKSFNYKESKDRNIKLDTTIEFPDNTKKINRVIFEYETKDGTITYIDRNIDCPINPKRVIVLKQGRDKKAGVEIDLSDEILNELDLDEKLEVEDSSKDSDVEIIKKTDFYTEVKSKNRRDDPFKEDINDEEKKIINDKDFIEKVKLYDFISIDLYKNRFIIVCYNKIKKQFMINGTNKIVIDFKQAVKVETKTVKNLKKPYEYITIGIHRNYYRVVIKLNKLKKFNLKHTDLGYEVKFQ